MTDKVLTIPHTTNELVPLQLWVSGVPIVTNTGVQYAIATPDVITNIPTSWTNSELASGLPNARVNGLAAGSYRLWAKVTQGTEVAILSMGRLYLT